MLMMLAALRVRHQAFSIPAGWKVRGRRRIADSCGWQAVDLSPEKAWWLRGLALRGLEPYATLIFDRTSRDVWMSKTEIENLFMEAYRTFPTLYEHNDHQRPAKAGHFQSKMTEETPANVVQVAEFDDTIGHFLPKCSMQGSLACQQEILTVNLC